ncbi:MAG: SLBB domain-containing protein [Pseudomonadota bacterium]
MASNPLSSRSFSFYTFAIFNLLVFSLLSASLAFAQTTQPTQEQLEMLDQLPPDQRAAVIEALGSNAPQAGGSNLQRVNEESMVPVELTMPSVDPMSGESPIRRANAGSRIIISFYPLDTLSDTELARLREDPTLNALVGDQVFALDDSGVLTIPGLESVPLLGLSENEIERRLSASSYLTDFDLTVQILELQPTGIEALAPFGYDVFAPNETGFDAPTTGPVPADYVLGPGDTVRIQMYGNTNAIYEFDVTRDGLLNVPEIGPVTVAGISFSEFRKDVNDRVAQMMIGTQVSVTMGQLRAIRVFVLGDVNRPGSHTVGGLSTISGALYRSGGISDVGSLRKIQLKRNGRTVVTLDAYDLLLRGDTRKDRRLQPGDVIFVPPVGATISVGGAVKRPAIYETTGDETLADVVEMAGGLTADAFGPGARLERINDRRERRVIEMDLSAATATNTRVMSGDVLTVPEVLPDFEDTVTVSGHVRRPGPYQWFSGMRLTGLIGSTAELLEGVDPEYVLIRRKAGPAAPIEVVSANLRKALAAPGSGEDPLLQSRDQIIVFSSTHSRQRVIEPILDDLNRQATRDAPSKRVTIGGSVRAPGLYPYESQMRISDLIRAGGGLAEMAYTQQADLTRYSIVNGQQRSTEIVQVDLARALSGDVTADILLKEHDHLRISSVTNWQTEWSVEIDGEVNFPGVFRIQRGETLSNLIARAGGITDEAFAEGAVFLRESLKTQEREQMLMLAKRVEADLIALSLSADTDANKETAATQQMLLQQLRDAEAVGRLVINPAVLSAGAGQSAPLDDIELMDGDVLLIPVKSQVVTVLGEVQQGTSHVYNPELRRDDYIEMSGGATRRADRGMIYVVRASGAVVAGGRSRWFARSDQIEIRPGDTIVVPMEVDRGRSLAIWASVTQILYQVAIAIAAIDSFNN